MTDNTQKVPPQPDGDPTTGNGLVSAAGRAAPQPFESSRPDRRTRRLLYAAGAVILVYLAVAYVVMPLAWKRDGFRDKLESSQAA